MCVCDRIFVDICFFRACALMCLFWVYVLVVCAFGMFVCVFVSLCACVFVCGFFELMQIAPDSAR